MRKINLLEKIRKIIPSILVMIVFIICFLLLHQGVQKEKISEKFFDMQTRLELIAFQIESVVERDADFEQHRAFYEENLITSIQFIDSQQATFAAVYNSQFENVSARHATYEGSPFDPLIFPEFIESIKNNSYGTLLVSWGDTENNVSQRNIYICYRWVFAEAETPYLMTIGISKYSLASPSLDIVIAITFIIFFATFLILFGAVIYIVRDLYVGYRSIK